MAERLTEKMLSDGARGWKARPGNEYVIVEGDAPVVATLRKPTQGLIERVNRSMTSYLAALNRFERKGKRLAAYDAALADMTPGDDRYLETSDTIADLEDELQAMSPLSPDSEIYWLKEVKRRAKISLDVPDGFDWDDDDIVVTVLKRADDDFLSLSGITGSIAKGS